MHPILIHFKTWNLPTYGTFVFLAYLAAFVWCWTQIEHMPKMTAERFWLIIYAIFFGAWAGGKLLFIAANMRFHWPADDPYFSVGYVFYGGLLGATATGYLAARALGVPFWPAADHAGVAIPLAQSIGRLGCLGAGCCYGKPTAMPWGLRLGGDPASLTPRELWGVPLHPTQLYESLCDAAIFLFLLCVVLPKARKGKLKAGTVFLSYVILYSIARFAIEFFRGDDRGWSFASLWVSQWAAMACVAGSGLLLLKRGIAPRKI